ncbi:hypothetical protein JCM11957_10750 [Caminibacter profundus]
MKRTELYLEDNLYLKLEKLAKENNVTISEYISNLLKSNFKKNKDMVGVWKNRNIDLDEIRKSAWE